MVKKKNKCPKCGKKLIKIASNFASCSNINCDFRIINSNDGISFSYFVYEDSRNRDFYQLYDVDNYVEDYDSLLFFSDRSDYITRLEYRENTDFIEEKLFTNKKCAKFKRYLDNDKVNEELLNEKYQLIDKGRVLEKYEPHSAYDYYKSIEYNPLFENDYYIHRKLVKLCDDDGEKLNLIIRFFKSGIYCNRHNYLWFLKKLYEITDKLDVSCKVIDDSLRYFKKHGFKNKNEEDSPFYLAEKITKTLGKLCVRTEKEYSYRQFKYELSEEASQLNLQKEYEYVKLIYERLILDYGFRSIKFYKRIINHCHKLNKVEDEIRWLNIYLNRVYGKKHFDYAFLESKLSQLVPYTNNFSHNCLFFDKNEYYLNEKDFRTKSDCNLQLENYFDLVKEKGLLIKKASKLEKNPSKAIEFYYSLLDNDLFKNDYYIYKKLILLHDDLNEFEDIYSLIRLFFESEIYCDRYNYLFFMDYLKKVHYLNLISYDEINYLLEFFREHGFKNQNLENTPVPISERLTFDKNYIGIIPGHEFSNNQLIESLNLEIFLYYQNSMLTHVNDTFKILIRDYFDTPLDIYEEMCDNYREINDYESELKCINEFLDNVSNIHYDEKYYLSKRLDELNQIMTKNPNDAIIEDCELEIFFENNKNFLSYDDFKTNLATNTELLDVIRFKNHVLNKGRKLENDYEKATEFYEPLLKDNLFKNDYYIYRRLLMVYLNFGEYDLAYDIIKDFFNSGIYCNRYQYLWFLHKLDSISRFRFISDDEITDMLKSFKRKGFKNDNLIIFTDRLSYNKSSVVVKSSIEYLTLQKKYELKEEISQLELNHQYEKAAKVLRKLIDMHDYPIPKNYMRLCHLYRQIEDSESEKELINEYLSKYNYSRSWFKQRLKELDD